MLRLLPTEVTRDVLLPFLGTEDLQCRVAVLNKAHNALIRSIPDEFWKRALDRCPLGQSQYTTAQIHSNTEASIYSNDLQKENIWFADYKRSHTLYTYHHRENVFERRWNQFWAVWIILVFLTLAISTILDQNVVAYTCLGILWLPCFIVYVLRRHTRCFQCRCCNPQNDLAHLNAIAIE